MWFVSSMVWTTLYYILFGLMRLLVGLILNLWMGQLEQKIGELPFLLIGISRNLTNQLLICAPAAPMLTHSLWSVSMYYSTTSHHTTVHCPLLWEILIHCATDQSNSIFGTALQPQSNCWLQCWGAKNKSSHDVLLHTWCMYRSWLFRA